VYVAIACPIAIIIYLSVTDGLPPVAAAITRFSLGVIALGVLVFGGDWLMNRAIDKMIQRLGHSDSQKEDQLK
jgi:hypothetical protein